MTTNTPPNATQPAVDPAQLKFCFGDDCFRGLTIRKWEFREALEKSQIVKSASALFYPSESARWDYHAETVLEGPQGLRHSGVCIKAKRQSDGGVKVSLEGTPWSFERAIIKNFETFGMSHMEIAYWLPLLTGLAKKVVFPGFAPNNEMRPFLYAVPLMGLTCKGEKKSFFATDLGVASGEHDDLFAPFLAKSKIGSEEPDWAPDVPKAWGIVLAKDFLDAESLSLRRARFTADLMNFALHSGISHFDTRYDSVPFEWDADIGGSAVSLKPWILLRDATTSKGWIRTVPMVQHVTETDLDPGYDRIMFFLDRFANASAVGGLEDQRGRRNLSKREAKLSTGIQRSLRWLGIASSEESIGDRFIAMWISLESILNSIDYPGVFEGSRSGMRKTINEGIRAMAIPNVKNSVLSISSELIRNRVFQGQWPLRTKLSLFAKSCGIEISTSDSELVRDLGVLRGDVFHAGEDSPEVSASQLRRLRYLTERLVIAASVFGYEDVEESVRHSLRFGRLGPEGGAAPLFLNEREVPYRLTVEDRGDQQLFELVIEGKVYSDRNADIGFAQDSGS